MLNKWKNVYVKNSFLVVIILYLFLVFTGKYIYFVFFDAANYHPTATTLMNLMDGSVSAKGISQNFVNVARILKVINFLKLDTFNGLEVYFTIILNVLALILIFKNKKVIDTCNIIQLLFLLLSIVLLNAYVFTMSKEPAIFLSILLVYITIQTDRLNDRNKYIIVGFELILMAVFIKMYYFMIIIQYIFMTLFLKHRNSDQSKINVKSNLVNVLIIVFASTILYFFIAVALHRILPTYYSKFLETASNNLEEASSRITPIFNGSGDVVATMNYFIKIFRLLFPIELLTKGIMYYPYVIVQFFVSVYALDALVHYNDIKRKEKLFILVYVGFLLTSAAFEPDFSSWTRHEFDLWPILLGVMKIDREHWILQDMHSYTS